MARGVNKVILIGNCGKDPETRYSAGNMAITKVTIATSDSRKDKETGQWQDQTEWHRVVFFGKLAEIAGQYLKKGAKVYVEGSLRTNSYEKEGQKHYQTEVIAAEMQLLDSRNGGGGGAGGGNDASFDHGFDQPAPARPMRPAAPAPGPSAGSPAPAPSGSSRGGEFDDDLPF